MSIRLYAAVFASAMTFYSCGFETSDEDNFKDNSASRVDKSRGNGADATATKKTSSETEKNNATDVECDGIAVHGFHLGCDDDDLTVQEQIAAGTEVEKTEAEVLEKPVVKPVETPIVVVPAKDPNIVEFRIKAGTGNGGWNTQAEIVNAKVGQTIRVFNDDTIIHRLHTGNNAPCAHGINIPVGTSSDCVVGKAFDSNASNGVYDHIAGTGAKIWIKAE